MGAAVGAPGSGFGCVEGTTDGTIVGTADGDMVVGNAVGDTANNNYKQS